MCIFLFDHSFKIFVLVDVKFSVLPQFQNILNRRCDHSFQIFLLVDVVFLVMQHGKVIAQSVTKNIVLKQDIKNYLLVRMTFCQRQYLNQVKYK